MQLLHPFTVTFFILLIVNLVIITLLIRANKSRIDRNKKMVADWQLQNTYMNHTLEFCHKAGEITSEVRDIIENQVSSTVKEEACIEKCGQLLDYMHGGNSAVEALILHKKNLCQSGHISFIDNIKSLPAKGAIPEMDTVSVLGNILDNAIEAATVSKAAAPFVEFSSIIKKNVWIIKVTNSKDPLLSPKKSGMQTTKGDKKSHGLGMNILKATISRYNGSLKTSDLGDTFQITAFLTLKKVRGAK